MTEAQWRAQVVDLAMLFGWRIYAVENTTREIVRSSGARIRVRNVNAQGVGFPDLVLVRARDRRLLFVELKRDKGATAGGGHQVTPEQETWLADLERVADRAAELLRCWDSEYGDDAAPLIGVHVWRPADFTEIERILA